MGAGAADGMNRGDWRRENMNRFVEAMYSRGEGREAVRAMCGISPFGIWRPGVPATIEARLDCYAHLFADSRRWLAEGWCDYLAPQLYWAIEPAKQSFPVLLELVARAEPCGEADLAGHRHGAHRRVASGAEIDRGRSRLRDREPPHRGTSTGT